MEEDKLDLAQEELYGYRRVARRHPCAFEGNYSLTGAQQPLRCKNISSKGARIITPEHMADSAFITLEFKTPDKGALIAKARVCWSKWLGGKWESGVVFNYTLPFDVRKFV